MGDVPPLGIRVRRERLIRPPVWLWAILALFIVYGTLLPFHFVGDRSVVDDRLAHITLNRLASPDTNRGLSIPDVAQNMVLFLPFGLLGALALDRRGANRAVTIAKVTTIAAVFSAFVETLQLFTLDRTTSLVDVIASTIGALAGALACGPLTARWAQWAPSPAAARGRVLMSLPAFYPLVTASLLVGAAAWAPFDVTFDVGNLVGKLHAFRTDPWQAGPLDAELMTACRWLVFGLTLGLWLRQVGTRAAVPVAIVAGSVAMSTLQAGQWLIATRMPGLQDAVVQSAATTAGALASLGWPYRGSPMFWWILWSALTTIGGALELRSPMAHDPMARMSRAFEVVAWVAPVIYGWYLVRREQSS